MMLSEVGTPVKDKHQYDAIVLFTYGANKFSGCLENLRGLEMK